LGGDYVFLHPDTARLAELERRLAALPATRKIAVLGNHDLWTHHRRVETALQNAGVQVLVNDTVMLAPDYPDVAVMGLDEPWTGEPKAQDCLATSRHAQLRIALCHSPVGLEQFSPGQINLMLSGHTHGGHIALPGPRPVIMPPGQMCRRYPWGLHQVNGTWLFVSRGVGGAELPIRINASPDVALFTLR